MSLGFFKKSISSLWHIFRERKQLKLGSRVAYAKLDNDSFVHLNASLGSSRAERLTELIFPVQQHHKRNGQRRYCSLPIKLGQVT